MEKNANAFIVVRRVELRPGEQRSLDLHSVALLDPIRANPSFEVWVITVDEPGLHFPPTAHGARYFPQ